MKIRRWEAALAAGLLGALLLCVFPICEQEELAGKLTRLHVLANSDSPEDQALKLKVRDAVLAASQGETQPDDAMLRRLQCAAAETIRKEGAVYPVTVSRENCYFETRQYETFSLPAGYYDAVRVVIGEGRGHNWWCVIYPPLCAGVCEEELACIAREAGLTDGQFSLICEKEGYVIRFRLADWWGRVMHALREAAN